MIRSIWARPDIMIAFARNFGIGTWDVEETWKVE